MKICKLDCKKGKERQRSQAKHTWNGIFSAMLKIAAKNIPMEPLPQKSWILFYYSETSYVVFISTLILNIYVILK